MSQFSLGKYDDAINAFLELDLNPAKVVALYPQSISGRLSVPREQWIALFGGSTTMSSDDIISTSSSTASKEFSGDRGKQEGPTRDILTRSPSPTGSVARRANTTFSALLPSAMLKDDDTASVDSKRKPSPPGMYSNLVPIFLLYDCLADNFYRSVDTLWRYLTDRRPKVTGALAGFNITPALSHTVTFLSEIPTNDLFALPNMPLSSLNSEQLIRFAQIIDTALFKSYLVIKPSLLGPLCRVQNWCEVSEVEEELRAREV